MKKDLQSVARRLNEIAEQQGGASAFAEKLGIGKAQMSHLLKGRYYPGNKMRERMKAIGVDDYYIMYGTKQEQQKKFEANVLDMLRNAEPDKAKILDLCDAHGIKTPEQLEQILNAYDAMKSVVLNEPKTGYNRKGK